MQYLLFIALFMMTFPAQAQTIEEDQTAVNIMAYYGVGRDEFSGFNVTRGQFKAHLRELSTGSYNVVALPDVLDAYAKNAPLPQNSVVITFDGSDKSILTEAAPLLKQYQFPFTVFLAPERIRENSPRYLNRKDIKRLQRLQLVNFGLHPEDYDTDFSDDVVSIRSSLNNAVSFYRDLFDTQPALLAFPQGVYSKTQLEISQTYGFKALFGQQSGTTYQNIKGSVLPRFVMSEHYADQSRFRMTANALPIPAKDVTPEAVSGVSHTPIIGFTTSKNLNLEKLSCYATGQSKPTTETLNDRIEIRLKQEIDEPRFRVNCTLPVKNEEGNTPNRWRWFGLLLSVH